MEISYYKDLQHNYLLIGLEEPDRNNYQFRMIEQNTLKKLLPCTIHNLNNGVYLYYEVDSRESLVSRCKRRPMRFEDIERLLMDLKEAGEEAGEYLLDPAGILLSRELIFEDPQTGRFYFLFCPVSGEHYSFEGLCQELVELTDPSDAGAIDMVYCMCERAMNGTLLPSDALAILESSRDKSCQKPVQEDRPADIRKPAVIDNTFIAEPLSQDKGIGQIIKEGMGTAGLFNRTENSKKNPPRSEKTETAVSVSSGMLERYGYLLMALAFLAVSGALAVIRRFYYLTREENALDVAGAIVCAVMGIYGIVRFITKRNECKKEKPTERTLSDSNSEEPSCQNTVDERLNTPVSVRKAVPKEAQAPFTTDTVEESRDPVTPIQFPGNAAGQDNRIIPMPVYGEDSQVILRFSRGRVVQVAYQ